MTLASTRTVTSQNSLTCNSEKERWKAAAAVGPEAGEAEGLVEAAAELPQYWEELHSSRPHTRVESSGLYSASVTQHSEGSSSRGG